MVYTHVLLINITLKKQKSLPIIRAASANVMFRYPWNFPLGYDLSSFPKTGKRFLNSFGIYSTTPNFSLIFQPHSKYYILICNIVFRKMP